MKGKNVVETKRVLIAVPCYAHCEPDTMKSIYDLRIPPHVETSLVFITGYTVVQARNRIVEKSLKDGYDYTLFVDSDVVLPNGLLERLLALDADIACGWYVKKIPGEQEKITEIYTLKFDGQSIRN
ncbi:MAG: glycosyltransferase family 2 protein, partial [Firmicutes bacterium]|nr:glycosyltransferase family 2 protein [Bacillota bacterium]MCL2798145.1 glycosyltransferase family 2 protein [Bacillota bacterium]